MKHLIARLLGIVSFALSLCATAQPAPQLDYLIGNSCKLPPPGSLSLVDVQLGVPVNVFGTSCSFTPIPGAADLHFSSTDIGATLPPAQRFLPGGRRLLGQVIFNSLGQQELRVRDSHGINGVSFEVPDVVVTPPTIAISIGLDCSQPDPFALPRFVAGQSVTIIGYPCGTLPPARPRITFASSDALAQLPISPFASADPIGGIPFTGANGAFLGRARFFTLGLQSLSATDSTLGFRADVGFLVVAAAAEETLAVPAIGGIGIVALAGLLLLCVLALSRRQR